MSIKSYKDLAVWMRARVLVKRVYQLSATFPKEEQYGLVSQMRRAAVSIPSNLAEGHARPGRRDFAQFVAIALGSSAELETQILLSTDLGYATEPSVSLLLQEIDELQKMMHKLHQTLL